LLQVAVYLNADPIRLAQIVGNLLNNACKFSDRGGRIWLTVERTEPSGAGAIERASRELPPNVVIRVRDTGLGIAADQHSRIFEMFTQVDTTLQRSATGLGIGLPLVKTLTEMHGGTVDVSSAGIGQSSEFIVRLPILVERPRRRHFDAHLVKPEDEIVLGKLLADLGARTQEVKKLERPSEPVQRAQ
jgi:signal transduction histidine kinase